MTLKLDPVFADGMILQAGKTVKICGNGNGEVKITLGELCHRLTYPCKQGRQGRKELHKEAEDAGAAFCKALAVFLAYAFGQHLTGKEHHNSGDNRTYRNGAQSPALCYGYGYN